MVNSWALMTVHGLISLNVSEKGDVIRNTQINHTLIYGIV